MASEHHANSSVKDANVRISGYKSKELDKGSAGVFGSRSLFLAKLIDNDKEFFYQKIERNIEGGATMD